MIHSYKVVIVNHKRSRLETYAAILEAVSLGAQRPTNIMFQANLSWSPLNDSLEILVRQGFLEESKYGKRTVYSLTSTGNDVLDRLQKIERDFDLVKLSNDDRNQIHLLRSNSIVRSEQQKYLIK